jgi:hypothetical protein
MYRPTTRLSATPWSSVMRSDPVKPRESSCQPSISSTANAPVTRSTIMPTGRRMDKTILVPYPNHSVWRMCGLSISVRKRRLHPITVPSRMKIPSPVRSAGR